jgi:hypothetical protein
VPGPQLGVAQSVKRRVAMSEKNDNEALEALLRLIDVVLHGEYGGGEGNLCCELCRYSLRQRVCDI